MKTLIQNAYRFDPDNNPSSMLLQIQAVAENSSSERIIIHYDAPWLISFKPDGSQLDEWRYFHERILALNLACSGKISIRRAGSLFGINQGSRAIAVLLERVYPELWDVLEALESVAELPDGEDPVFRDAIIDLSKADVLGLLTNYRLDGSIREANGRSCASAGGGVTGEDPGEAVLLLQQLHVTQDRLEQSLRRMQSLEDDICRQNAVVKDLQQQIAQQTTDYEQRLGEATFANDVLIEGNAVLQASLSRSESEVERLKRALADSREEGDLLLQQLQQVQAEFERKSIEFNVLDREASMAANTLHRIRTIFSAVLSARNGVR